VFCDGSLFFNFAEPFDFGFAHWLRWWALWSATCPTSGSGLSPAHRWSSCLSSLCLLKVQAEITPCSSPFSCALSEFLLLLLCACFQFFDYCSWFFVFFFLQGGQSAQGLRWFIPGLAGGIPCDSWHSPVWSTECLPSRFGDGVWWQEQPSNFLSITWYGKTFYRLGVQGVEVLILLGALSVPSVAPASQQSFWFTELILSASAP
jgi:hypothetical protein